MNYLVLIGDIKDSKKIKDRQALQERLAATFRALNRNHPSLLSPFTITLGDEFQAVYQQADELFRDIFAIEAAIAPQKVRFSLGIGAIRTALNRRQAIGMDGPAFHQARRGIEQLKQTSLLFTIAGENIPHLNLANRSLYLLSHLLQGWSANRFRILSALLREKSVKEIARDLDISSVAVYKNMKAGALETVISLTKSIANFLNEQVGTQ